jgi:phosphoribosylamine--glycine ligase
MAEKVGILVVSYGSRAVAMVDAFSRSGSYEVELYIADKQRNPYNLEKAHIHQVIPDLDVDKILKFAGNYRDKIDFGIVGPEGPIIAGVRDEVEDKLDIPMICPTKEYALEESKVRQRELMAESCLEANPRFKVFNRRDYKSIQEAKKEVYLWLDSLENQAAVKPDRPGYGKGVGVWGDHFNTREELFEHFLTIYEKDSVIIEEKIDGEESSFQCFCDGRNITPLPETRDYKRAFDNDEGPNTGGMGCYKNHGDYLPFMTAGDRDEEVDAVNKIFRRLKGGGINEGLRGIPLYVAFIHSRDGIKILEINSRGGDPEIQTVLPLIEDDFTDVCFKMIEGNLRKINFDPRASVLTYKVPPGYGGFKDRFPEKIDIEEINTPIDLSQAYGLKSKHGDSIRIYPGSMEVRNGKTYSGGSRTVCCIGIADNIEEAREISLGGMKTIKGGALWHRKDIASKEHINKSIEHMRGLRK